MLLKDRTQQRFVICLFTARSTELLESAKILMIWIYKHLTFFLQQFIFKHPVIRGLECPAYAGLRRRKRWQLGNNHDRSRHS